MDFVTEASIFLVLKLIGYPLKKEVDKINFRTLASWSYKEKAEIREFMMFVIVKICEENGFEIKNLSRKLNVNEAESSLNEQNPEKKILLKKILDNNFNVDDLREFLMTISNDEYKKILREIDFDIIISDEKYKVFIEKLDNYIDSFIDDKIKNDKVNYLIFSKQKEIALANLHRNFNEYGKEFVISDFRDIDYRNTNEIRFLETVLALHKLSYIKIQSIDSSGIPIDAEVEEFGYRSHKYLIKITVEEKLLSETENILKKDEKIQRALENIPKRYHKAINELIKEVDFYDLEPAETDIIDSKKIIINKGAKIRLVCPTCGVFISEIKNGEEISAHLKRFIRKEFVTCKNKHQSWFTIKGGKILFVSVPNDIEKILSIDKKRI